MRSGRRIIKTATAGILAVVLLSGCAEEKQEETMAPEATLKEEYRAQDTTAYAPSLKVSRLAEIGAPESCDLEAPVSSYGIAMKFHLSVEVPDAEQVYRIRTRVKTFDEKFVSDLAAEIGKTAGLTWEGTPEKFQTETVEGENRTDKKQTAAAEGKVGEDICRFSVTNYLGEDGEQSAEAFYIRYPDTEKLSAERGQVVRAGEYRELWRGQEQEADKYKLEITKSEAQKQAEAFLEKIGITGVQVASVKGACQEVFEMIPDGNQQDDNPDKLVGTPRTIELRRGWCIRFSHVIDAVPVNVFKPNAAMERTLQEEKEKAAEAAEEQRKQLAAEQGVSVGEVKIKEGFPYAQLPEQLYVVVGDNGIMQFGYNAPLELEKMTKVPAELITWNDVAKIVEQNGLYFKNLTETDMI